MMLMTSLNRHEVTPCLDSFANRPYMNEFIGRKSVITFQSLYLSIIYQYKSSSESIHFKRDRVIFRYSMKICQKISIEFDITPKKSFKNIFSNII